MEGPRPVVLSGPSGAGKSTLMKMLLRDYDGVFGFSVSHTTRSPRPGEVDGKDYHFSNREAMQEDIDDGTYIENAEFSGNLYGTSKSSVDEVRANGLICILDVDIQGVRNIKQTDLDPIYVSIQPPSIEILEKRLRDRNTETEESLQKRLEAARVDMELSNEPGVFDMLIVNDDLEEAYEKLQSVLIEEITKVQSTKKERCNSKCYTKKRKGCVLLSVFVDEHVTGWVRTRFQRSQVSPEVVILTLKVTCCSLPAERTTCVSLCVCFCMQLS
ncbi:unnamed protein product [Oncorhynchus mykiss]|uniref:Guanylate kinase n=1 Tax=Oncorhynchus mykiss TaxID=8022 RepID=A0A060XFY5_ONCMY|nr:unnamed protein product [Oncorhynchus mykiss]